MGHYDDHYDAEEKVRQNRIKQSYETIYEKLQLIQSSAGFRPQNDNDTLSKELSKHLEMAFALVKVLRRE